MSKTIAKSKSPNFNLDFDPRHGEAIEIAPGIRRITAKNSSPLTFKGTNTYIIGFKSFLILDPGPEEPEHLNAIEAATSGGAIAKIALTHTHIDHSQAAHPLAKKYKPELIGEGEHRLSRPLLADETNPLDAAGDINFRPDRYVKSGDRIEIDGLTLEIVETPGHCANHIVFALEGTDILFSGDHVMSWSTSIVAPPDGAMADYMASLDLLLERNESHYLPGHGSDTKEAKALVKGLKTHRIMRENAIFNEIQQGRGKIDKIVERVYHTTPKSLHSAAALSVLAHIEDLLNKGRIESNGPARLHGEYRVSTS